MIPAQERFAVDSISYIQIVLAPSCYFNNGNIIMFMTVANETFVGHIDQWFETELSCRYLR